MLVLDASEALAWAFEDEGGPASETLLSRLVEEDAVVPPVWPLEVGNALLAAERRGRISSSEVGRFVALLEALLIEVDRGGSDRALGATLDLARQHGLSTYDASYLELAIRKGASLATRDEALRRAAESLGVSLAV